MRSRQPKRCSERLLRGGVAAAAAAVLAAGATAAAPPSPTLAISKAAVDRTTHTVDVRLRLCFSSGPRARIVIHEQRKLGAVLKASHRWSPRGVEPRRIAPFACRGNWRLNWLLEPDLRGAGAYTADIRVQDAYGRWTAPVSIGVTSP